MKGKIGLVVGLGVGYVLGARAGRERYEQIKTQWLKVWNLDPVQHRVAEVKGFVGEKAAAVPGALWHGAVKIAKSVGSDGTPGQKLDATIAAGKEAVEEVADATEDAAAEVKKTAKSTSTSSKRTSTGSAPAQNGE